MMAQEEIIYHLLKHEHIKTAERLGFLDKSETHIEEPLLIRSIGLIDTLSRSDSEHDKKVIITLCSILWTYRNPSWDGLKDFLILILSRIGYSPSSIMVDDKYDKSDNIYSPTNSLISELLVTTCQLRHEIYIEGNTYLLTKFQRTVWSKIDEHKILGISAPTSAGKSFIIALKSIDLILKKQGAIIYIVPTLSLVSQVSIDFRNLLNKFGISNYEILNTYIGEYSDTKKIFVLTQEKAIGALTCTP